MKILRISSRRLVLLPIAVAALAALALEVALAGASPATGPPIAPQSPPDGAAVEASGEALKVTFSCPPFVYEEGEVIEEEETEGEEEGEESEGEEEGEIMPPPGPVIGPPTLGGAENYAVHYSTSPAVSAAGQLGTSGFGEAGEGESEAIKGTGLCSSELELPTKPFPATLYEGRVYWQAYRESTVVPDEIEVGPVRSFVVVPHVEEPELIFREQIFAGYLTRIGLGYEAELEGAVVELQEWNGKAWTKIAEAPGSNAGENNFYVKPRKPGRHLFRPVVTAGSMAGPLPLERVAKVVRKPTRTRVTGAADDGAYVAANAKEREEWPIEMHVTGGGTTLKNLKVEAETTCKGPTKAQDVKLEVPAVLRHAKIAPDGTVFGVSKTAGPEVWTVTLVGSLFHGRFQGELSTSRTNCTGYRTIDAILARSVRK